MRAGKRVLAVLLAAAALPGCGGSDEGPDTRTTSTVDRDQRGILETIDELQTASLRGDGRKICADVFTPQLARSVAKASMQDCAKEVREKLFRADESISVQRGVEVDGIRATAVIREQNGDVSTLHMLKQAARWRIDRITPRGAS